MGAVTVGVEIGEVRELRLVGQVGAVDDLVGLIEADNGGDPGVDERHVDPLASVALLVQLAR